MDRNFFFALALSFLVLVVWSMWQSQQREGELPEGRDPAIVSREVSPPSSPGGSAAPSPPATAEKVSPAPPVPPVAPPQAEERVDVITALFAAELTTRGGALTRWELSKFQDASLPERPNVELTTLDGRREVALATPFVELGLGDLSQAPFELERRGELELLFRWAGNGLTLRKLYRFEPDSYAFRLRIELENHSPDAVEPRFDVVWPARPRDSQDFVDQMLLVMNEGSVDRVPVLGVGKSGVFSRLFGGGGSRDGGPVFHEGDIEWAGAQTRYFLTVLLPDLPREAQAQFVPIDAGEAANAVVGFRPARIPSTQRIEREYRVYLGPKELEHLEAIGANLDQSIDFGWSWVAPLTRAFTWLLRACYAVIPNYGVAIILITLLVRLGMAPLMSKQMRSMKRMGELQPKIKALQEKHADDRQLQSQEMMKLYRESGVNPLGGCFPMLLQFPVFIGLFYALRGSIALRQEPFVLWINDLSAPDTLFVLPGLEVPVRVLPLLMGVSMVLQQKLTPTSMDPAQARMMMTVMPVMFTVLFYQFPSGLVLYWFVSNLLGIAQQLWVNRRVTQSG